MPPRGARANLAVIAMYHSPRVKKPDRGVRRRCSGASLQSAASHLIRGGSFSCVDSPSYSVGEFSSTERVNLTRVRSIFSAAVASLSSDRPMDSMGRVDASVAQ